MPKLQSIYTETLNLRVEKELKNKLIALSYSIWFAGNGEYSKLARAFLERSADKQIEELSPKQKEQFDQTYENLVLQDKLKMEKILGIETKKEEKENGTNE